MYPLERDAAVTEAGGSILAYQQWVESGDGEKLAAIEEYNADDCRSTAALRDWLLDEKAEAEREFGVEIAALRPPDARPVTPEQEERAAELAALETQLAGDDPVRQLAADLLQYHRREARPQ